MIQKRKANVCKESVDMSGSRRMVWIFYLFLMILMILTYLDTSSNQATRRKILITIVLNHVQFVNCLLARNQNISSSHISYTTKV